MNLNIQNFFTSHGGYLLNTTLLVPGVGISVAGLDLACEQHTYFRSSFLSPPQKLGGREATTGNTSAVRRLV